MRSICAALIALTLATQAQAQAYGSRPMEIQRNGAKSSLKGPAQNFTGTVRIDTPFQAKAPARPGDVIWCPPNHKHWHGATATTAMTHIAIAESLDGRAVDWLEPVTDAQYLAGVGGTQD